MNKTLLLPQLLLAATLVLHLPARAQETAYSIMGMGGDAVQVYDNWDIASARLEATGEGDARAFKVGVTPITNIPYFEKGLTVVLPPTALPWEAFDGLRAAIATNIEAEYVKFLIEETDGENWVASAPFLGTGSPQVYAVSKDQFAYGWGGAEEKKMDKPVRRLTISLYRATKPVGKVEMDFSGVEFVTGMPPAAGGGGGASGKAPEWDFAAARESALGWKPSTGMTDFKVEGGSLSFRMTGDYAYTATQPVAFDASSVGSLRVKMRVKGASNGKLGMYFSTKTIPEINESTKVIDEVKVNDRFEEQVIEVGRSPAWEGTLTGFRLDFNFPPGTLVEISRIQFQ